MIWTHDQISFKKHNENLTTSSHQKLMFMHVKLDYNVEKRI